MKTYHLTFDDYFIQNKTKQAAQRERGGEGCTKVHFYLPCIELADAPSDWLCDDCKGKKQVRNQSTS